MKGFFEYLESNGVKDIKRLTGFVHNFLQDLSFFFDLTEAERDGMEKKLLLLWEGPVGCFCNTIMALLPMLISAIMIYVVGISKLHN